MKKIILILLFTFLSSNMLAQANPIYITGTTVVCPGEYVGIFEGFSKMVVDPKSFNAQPSKIYYIGNCEKNYEITLMHYNYVDKENNPEILDMPITELENFDNIIPAEDLLKFETADKAYNWMLDKLKSNAKIYVIETNDYYKSDPTLDAPDRMKVIEVRISYQSIPDYILSPMILTDENFTS